MEMDQSPDEDSSDLELSLPPNAGSHGNGGGSLDFEVEATTSPPRLSTQERLRLAKRRRAEQLKRWAQREREWKKTPASSSNGAPPNLRTGANGFNGDSGGKGVTFESSIVLLEAAARNDLEEVRRLLELGVSPDSTNEDGLTALHQCCIDDSEEMMKILVEYGGNPNATDTERWTPLHAAATCGHLHLVKFLIDAGADLLSVNADGNMPYDLCEDETTLSYIENEMARRGVTQDIIDDTRSEIERRMLHDLQILQMEGGDLDFVRPATGKGAAVAAAAADSNGGGIAGNATPLHIASANGYLSVVEFLLEHHVSTDVEDEDLWQPIHAAACWGHLEIVEVLAQNGANINARTRNGETPFDICEDPDIKERLVQLKEQRLLSEQPRVRRSRSASTRTQSIRRTSLREKMNTTKRDVQDEKMHFMQKFDHDKRNPMSKNTLSPDDLVGGVSAAAATAAMHSGGGGDNGDIVDIQDVELTILPSYALHNSSAAAANNNSQQEGKEQQQQHTATHLPTNNNQQLAAKAVAAAANARNKSAAAAAAANPSPPQRPPRSHDIDDKSGQFVNRVVLSGGNQSSPSPSSSSSAAMHHPSVSVRVNDSPVLSYSTPPPASRGGGGHPLSHHPHHHNKQQAPQLPHLSHRVSGGGGAQQQQQLPSCGSSPSSQTLSDLKKQRSMSRVKHPSPQQQQQSQRAPPAVAAAAEASRNNGSNKEGNNGSSSRHSGGGSNHGLNSRSSSGSLQQQHTAAAAAVSPNIEDDDLSRVDRKFAASNSEVVGPPHKKKSCCKIM